MERQIYFIFSLHYYNEKRGRNYPTSEVFFSASADFDFFFCGIIKNSFIYFNVIVFLFE